MPTAERPPGADFDFDFAPGETFAEFFRTVDSRGFVSAGCSDDRKESSAPRLKVCPAGVLSESVLEIAGSAGLAAACGVGSDDVGDAPDNALPGILGEMDSAVVIGECFGLAAAGSGIAVGKRDVILSSDGRIKLRELPAPSGVGGDTRGAEIVLFGDGRSVESARASAAAPAAAAAAADKKASGRLACFCGE